MKNRYWLIGGCVALLFSYLLNIVESKDLVYCEVNRIFGEESVHWIDSITEINDQLDIFYYDRRKYRAKKLHISITEEDTVIIPCKFFHPQNSEVFSRKTAETAAIFDGGEKNGYDFTVVDSLFQRSLRNAGIDAELAIELYVKDLAEMFPTEDSEARLAVELHAKGLMNTFSGRDSMNADAPIRHIYKSKELDGGVPTDTVGLGICDQGKLVAKTRVSATTILARMELWSAWQTWVTVLLLLSYSVVWGRRKYLKSVKPYINNMYRVGNTCFDFNNRIVVYWNGEYQRMIGNKVQFLKMLVESAPAYKLLKEDVCKAMWKRNSKDGQSLYAVMVNDVRGNYLSEDDSLELETLLKEGVVLHVDETKLKTHPKTHFIMLYLKNRFYLYVEE